MDDVTAILDQLNSAPREAVSAPQGNLLVLAGAGSGKTRVLVHRIAWLMQAEGLSPYALLAVTFTNKAAKEMRTRLEALLSISMRHVWVGTFHSIAHRLLRQVATSNRTSAPRPADGSGATRPVRASPSSLSTNSDSTSPPGRSWTHCAR